MHAPTRLLIPQRFLNIICAGVYSAIRLLTVTGFLRRGYLQSLPSDERQRNAKLPVHDRALLLHGCKRNEVLSLSEIEQYGLDSFGNADYVSIYGMPQACLPLP